MKAEIKSMSSSDVDIASYSPLDTAGEAVWVRMLVGPAGLPGEETFDVFVCSSGWLEADVRAHRPRLGRHALVVTPFDLSAAASYLQRHVDALEGADWREVADQLARIAAYEFEDYSA